MRKGYIILGLVVAALIAVLSLMSRQLSKYNDEVHRLQHNQEALYDTITTYKCLDGLSAYQIKRLEMTKKEFEKTNNGLKQEIVDMQIKLKRLQSADKVVTETKYVFIPDTIYVRQNKEVKQVYTFEDQWIKFRLDTAGVDITTNDTIYVVRHQKVKRFLFWVRKRDDYVTVKNANPHSRVTTVESISLTQ